jgi:hypothetical protein
MRGKKGFKPVKNEIINQATNCYLYTTEKLGRIVFFTIFRNQKGKEN